MYEDIKNLIGKTISKIEVDQYRIKIYIICTDGSTYEMYHQQNCCESVDLEDICGDLSDLIDSPILDAREEIKDGESTFICDLKVIEPYEEASSTWTFYILRTLKGSVTLRWYGSSNGYYSESVQLYRTDKED